MGNIDHLILKNCVDYVIRLTNFIQIEVKSMDKINEKITKLAEYIKKEFPKGCIDQNCDGTCPLDDAKPESIETEICGMLHYIKRNSMKINK